MIDISVARQRIQRSHRGQARLAFSDLRANEIGSLIARPPCPLTKVRYQTSTVRVINLTISGHTWTPSCTSRSRRDSTRAHVLWLGVGGELRTCHEVEETIVTDVAKKGGIEKVIRDGEITGPAVRYPAKKGHCKFRWTLRQVGIAKRLN